MLWSAEESSNYVITCHNCLMLDPTFFSFRTCVYIETITVNLPRPVHTAPPQNPATSHSLSTQLSPQSHHFFWSTDWTHHLTLREWDLYWVQRKTLSSFEFTLSRSYFSNCRDSCYCRCRATATKSQLANDFQDAPEVVGKFQIEDRNQFSTMRWWF